MKKELRSRLRRKNLVLLVAVCKQTLKRFLLKYKQNKNLSPIERYRRDGYDSLITQNLGLSKESEVWDFGGYTGEWSGEIEKNYGCSITIFEPIPSFAEILRERFSQSDRIVIREYGIAGKDEKRFFHLSDDGTGVFAEGNAVGVSFRSASQLAQESPQQLALMAVNIEGGEYELIPVLEDVNLLPRIVTILIQFHKVGENWESDYETCRQLLAKTHALDWEYPFVWEKWTRKSLH